VTQTAREFFDSLPSRTKGKRVDGVDSSYVFDIAGSGTWTVKIDDGTITVAEGDLGGDCTVSTSEDVFSRIVAGKQNPLTAYMTGKLKVTGDVDAALRLKSVFG
jgi:putative sterol carrier protein